LPLSVGSFDLYKLVPDMTYNVFGGTLDLAQSINVEMMKTRRA